MAKTAIVTARIDAQTKDRAQEVLATANVSCSQAIQGLFDYIVHTGETPDFILDSYQYRPLASTGTNKYAGLLDWVGHGPLTGLDLSELTDSEIARTKQAHFDQKYGMTLGKTNEEHPSAEQPSEGHQDEKPPHTKR